MNLIIGDRIKIKDYDDDFIVIDINNDDVRVISPAGIIYGFSKNDIIKVERPCQYETIDEKREILTRKEREYLRAVIRPFRKQINSLVKYGYDCFDQQYIIIKYDKEKYVIRLPDFEKDTMYKGMELDKEYSLEELGL